MNALLPLRGQPRSATVSSFAKARSGHSSAGSSSESIGAAAGWENFAAIERPATIFAMQGSDIQAARLFCALVYHSGREFPIKALLGSVPQGGFDLGEPGIIAAMGNLGFYVRQKPFSSKDWSSSRSPLLIKSGDRPLLLVPGKKRGEALVYDGQVLTRFEEHGGLLEGSPCWRFDYESARSPLSPQSRSHTGYSWIRALFANFPLLGRTIILFSLMLGLTGALLPLAIAVFFGQVIRLSEFTAMPYLIGGLVLIVAFETLFIVQRTKVVAWVAGRLEFIVNTSSFAQILKLTPSISERAAPTNQAARLRSFESIRDFISGPTFASILDIPVSLLSLILVGFLSLSALSIMVGSIVLFCCVFAVAWRRSAILTSITADQATELQALCIETLDKLDLIRGCGLQQAWADRIGVIAEKAQRAQMSLRFAGLVSEAVSSVIFTVSIIGVMAVSSLSVWAGGITGPTLLALVILSLRVLAPFHTLCMTVQRIEQIRRSLNQINSLMDLPTENQEEREKNTIGAPSGRVSFVNVGFRAADTRPVFVGLDLEVDSGDLIGIYGANGTGKSTIFKMVLGMMDVSLGTIRIDGVDLRQLPLRELRRRVSYVPQRPRIFPGSLRQNLALANPLATEMQIDQVLLNVGLSEEIRTLPNGLDFIVSGPDEERFSASFRHRFAFARALLVNSQLMLIDEVPNALLDGETGALMRRLLEDARGRRTVLFVSHRTDFLQMANRVVALRYGKIPSVNTPQAILERAI
ncbi:MAG: ABC transporter [Rhizobiales bacterium]|nr:ABC transporter [Hyphomicrobiales bacterium]MBA68745.1 ABC transporter [Hyphomicrobiales bacterium]|tara:strand:+ start:1428 stop:3683 length:2256 start_codon:yes stop_codon:yes gene_type:complete